MKYAWAVGTSLIELHINIQSKILNICGIPLSEDLENDI